VDKIVGAWLEIILAHIMVTYFDICEPNPLKEAEINIGGNYMSSRIHAICKPASN
jgi:hypothetical protein